MDATPKTTITIQVTVHAPVEKIWKLWTTPSDIMHWNNASDDWHTPEAQNDVRTGGTFSFKMAAKDGSFSFYFAGTYDNVIVNKHIAYTIADGRKVSIDFSPNGSSTEVVESFEAESVNAVELQRGGWQAILNNFKKYAEALSH